MKEITARSLNAKPSWRDALPIHPYANAFPMMSESELKEMGKKIKKYGLQLTVAIWDSGVNTEPRYWFLDGRNRLDAMEMAGLAPRLGLPAFEVRASHHSRSCRR
jgi:hypothetical protein